MNRMPFAVLVAAALSPAATSGQAPKLLPRANEIALARSAAPPEVSADASVYVLEPGGYVLAEQGSNGVSCFVDRSQPAAIEPHCFDPEGSRTILPIRFAEAELRAQGRTREEIRAAVREGIESGRFVLPSRPVMSYMLSSAQELYNDEGRAVGAWRPHLMIYVPWLENADIGVTGTPSAVAPVVSDPGDPLASIVIVVPEFVHPQRAAGG